MDKDTKTLLLALGLGFVILFLTRPKKDNLEDKYSKPKEADSKLQKDKENAVISIQAMREAIKNGEDAKSLNKLKDMILQDYNIKIVMNKKNQSLKALNKEGKLIAQEE